MSFIPVIRPDTTVSTVKEEERLYKLAIRDALGDEKVAKAIAPYKTNGMVSGHKVLDDGEAVHLMETNSVGRSKEMFAATPHILLYRRTQLLNQELRKEWDMDRAGKLSGAPSPSKIKRLARKAAMEATSQLDLNPSTTA